MALTLAAHTPVKIHLVTKITHEDHTESFELVLFGRHYRKGKGVYLKYDEVQEEGTINTIVKITEDDALILRSGILKMRLNFKMKEELSGTHESPYGTFFLLTDTKKMIHEVEHDRCKGHFHLIYDLFIQGSKAGEYEMQIDYEEVKVNR